MPRPKKDGKFVNFYLKKDLAEQLDKYSEQTMIPKTSIMEIALQEYLEKVDPDNKEQ